MDAAYTSATKLTYADLCQMPDDGLRHELIDGVHYVSPSATVRHQRVVVEPDVLFLTTEQVVAQTGIHLHGAPALAIEVVSPGSRTMDLELKRGVYDRCGVQEYWIVDPDREEVQVHRRGSPAPWTLSSDRPLAPGQSHLNSSRP